MFHFFMQFTIGVRDQGEPSLFKEEKVTATIIREGDPSFGQKEYYVTIEESRNISTTIISIQATDPLQGVSTFIF